jgi:hypothetical protein
VDEWANDVAADLMMDAVMAWYYFIPRGVVDIYLTSF